MIIQSNRPSYLESWCQHNADSYMKAKSHWALGRNSWAWRETKKRGRGVKKSEIKSGQQCGRGLQPPAPTAMLKPS